MVSKPGKPSGMYYKTHYSSDSRKKIITDVLTTYADRSDVEDLIEVYNRVENRLEKLGLEIEEVSADKGYCSGKNLREFERRGKRAFIPTKEYVNTNGKMNNKEFTYDEEKDVFVCPNQKPLRFYSYDKQKQRNRYIAEENHCSVCPIKQECCPKAKRRSVSRTIYYQEYQRLEQRLKTPAGRRAIRIRKTVSEGLFAEAKMYHGLRKFMTRGIEKAQKRSYIIASVQNLKRLLGYMGRKASQAVQVLENTLANLFFTNKLKLCLLNLDKA